MLEWMFVGTLGGLGAVVLMGLEALNCLLTCRGKRRTRLLYAAAGLGIVLLLWWGGDALLRLIGLSWRRWVQTAFGVAALVLGMAGAFLTVHCGAEKRAGRLWHQAAVGIALLMLLACSVTIGPFLLAFSYAPERVLEVQGQPWWRRMRASWTRTMCTISGLVRSCGAENPFGAGIPRWIGETR